MDHITPIVAGKMPRLRFESDLRGWVAVTITPMNRNTTEYVDHVRHCLRTGDTVPHPRGAAEAAALEAELPYVAEMFADCGVVA